MIFRRNAEPSLLMGRISRMVISPERKPQNGRRISRLVHHHPTTESIDRSNTSRPRKGAPRVWVPDCDTSLTEVRVRLINFAPLATMAISAPSGSKSFSCGRWIKGAPTSGGGSDQNASKGQEDPSKICGQHFLEGMGYRKSGSGCNAQGA